MALLNETITPRLAYWVSPTGAQYRYETIAPHGTTPNQYDLSDLTLPSPLPVGIWELRTATEPNNRLTDEHGLQAVPNRLLATKRVTPQPVILLPLIDPEVGDIASGEHLLEVGSQGGIAKYVVTPRGDWFRFSFWVNRTNVSSHRNNGTHDFYNLGHYIPAGRDTDIRILMDYNDGSYQNIRWTVKPQQPVAPTQGSETTSQSVTYDVRTVAIAKSSVGEPAGSTAVFYDYRYGIEVERDRTRDFRFVTRYRGDRANINLSSFTFTNPIGEQVALDWYEAPANTYSTFQPADGWSQDVLGIRTASQLMSEDSSGAWTLSYEGVELAQYNITVIAPPPPPPANLNDDWYMEEGLNVYGPESALEFELPDADGGEAYGPDSYTTPTTPGDIIVSGTLGPLPAGMSVQIDAWDAEDSFMMGEYIDISEGEFEANIGDPGGGNFSPVVWATGATGRFTITGLAIRVVP